MEDKKDIEKALCILENLKQGHIKIIGTETLRKLEKKRGFTK